MFSMQRITAAIALATFMGTSIPGPALAGDAWRQYTDDRDETQQAYDDGAEEEDTDTYTADRRDAPEEEAAEQKSDASGALLALGALAVLGLMMGSFSGSDEAPAADDSQADWARQKREHEAWERERARQAHESAEASRMWDNCITGCP